MKAFAFFCLLLLTCYETLQAQLCTGSLGDPVVHIDFGRGSGAGPALPPSTTTYTHVMSSCPNDGEYSIVEQTFGCFSGSWHTVIGDHTPNDALGRYMLINASFTPGDFYVETVRGLCANTNYEFAAWIRNVLKPSSCSGAGIRPNLTFKIETVTGTVLATFNSGDIPNEDVAQWNQYGMFFQTPAGVSDVVIRLTNNAPGGCGNDLALDDITFRPCGPRLSAGVGVNGETEYNACESDNRTLILNATYSAVYNNPVFQWEESTNGGQTWTAIPGANSPSYTRPPSGKGVFNYRILIADGAANLNSVACRIASNNITVSVTQPVAQAVNYVFGCYGSTIAFYAAGGSVYNWYGPNGWTANIQGPSVKNVQFTDAGWYKVKVTDFNGCSDWDSTNLLVYPAAHAQLSPDITICEGKSTQLQASGGTSYYWEPQLDTIPNPVVAPTETTVYQLIMFNQYGCFDTASVKVGVWKKPIANAGPDKKTRLGLPVYIDGSVQGTDVNYHWTPSANISDVNKLKTQVNPPSSMTYTLHAVSAHGCGSHTDNVFVKVYEKILVPNAFSPNGDGINDYWIVEPLELFTESRTIIYNRYGQEVYRSNGYDRPWDGRRNGYPIPAGTYYYVIDLRINNEKPITGSVTIIR